MSLHVCVGSGTQNAHLDSQLCCIYANDIGMGPALQSH